MPDWTTARFVTELIARCDDGVFAWATLEGAVQTRLSKDGLLVINLGLAARLEEQCALASRDPAGRSDIARLAGQYPHLEVDQLEFATTDELLAELWRVTPGSWVLGMVRLKLKQQRWRHWSGLCWNGIAPICVSLAAVLANSIQQKIVERRLKDQRTLEEQIRQDLTTLARNIDTDDPPFQTWMIGVLRRTEALCHQLGPRPCQDDDLASFVKVD